MARRFLLAANETWAMAPAPDVMRATTAPPVRHTSSFNPTLAVAVSSVIVCFFLLGFATGTFKRYIVRAGEPSDFPENPRRRTNRSTKPRDVGLDPEVVSALPLVKFAELVQKGKHAEDCAVCLALFEDSDTLRLLPQCAHAFHSECIDEWFKSHSTCPLCRDSLKNLEAERARTEDQDAEGDGGMRRAAEFDVVEVVIGGESSVSADASAEISQEVATTQETAQVNPSTFIRAIRIGKSPPGKASIRRSSSVGTGLHLRPYVVDSEGTQHHNFRVLHAIALNHEQAHELSNGTGASESLAIGVLLDFRVGADGRQHAWSTRRSFPNLRQIEPP